MKCPLNYESIRYSARIRECISFNLVKKAIERKKIVDQVIHLCGANIYPSPEVNFN